MRQFIAHISLLIPDYDEAIAYFTQVLDFDLIEDKSMGEDKRWVLVRPKGDEKGCNLLLAKASKESQILAIGNQTGGRVFLFLHTDDIERDYKAYTEKGVQFINPPNVQPHGKVAIFKDKYGNLWDLIEAKSKSEN
jgi:catechol 2,3-dioxygenase-like lactoylglutathione lyase family enzyme